MLKKNYDISSRGEIMSKKSSSFLRGPRVPIILVAFPLWTTIEITFGIILCSKQIRALTGHCPEPLKFD